MRPEDELTCQELVELVTDYLDGALEPSDRIKFEAHLSDCPGCQNYLDQMRRTIRLLGTLSEEHLSADAREVLIEVFRDWKSGLSAKQLDHPA